MVSTDEAQPACCLNCEAALWGEYCQACGQRDLDPRASFWLVLGEFLQESFELDGRLPRTLIPFVFRPGFLAREFLAGRRRRYTSPVRLYVFVALLSFFMLQRGAADLIAGDDIVVTKDGVKVDRSHAMVEAGDDPDLPSRYEGLPPDALARTLLVDFFGWAPVGAGLLLFLYAGLLELFHRRVPFLTHLVASTHVHAFGLLVFGIAALTRQGIAGWIALAAVQLYVLVSLVVTYELRVRRALLEWIALNMIYWVLATAVFVAVVLAATQLGD